MNNTRRDFLKNLGLAIAASSFGSLDALAGKKEWFQISLAEWSLHKAIFGGTLDNLDFPAKAKNDFGIDIVEYVNTCFKSKTKTFKENGSDSEYLKELLKRCKDNGVKNHLIMCDAEGNLGDSDAAKRKQTVENHYKWVDAAKYLGCATIRVNAGGNGTAEEVAKNAADGLYQLGEFAAKSKINVIVENHGGYSSNGKWLAGVMKTVNLKNVGTLPDFGNFCIERQKNDWRVCLDEYDRYLGTEELMPYAKGVSAKANNFKENGDEAVMDYSRLLTIVKKSGFKGIIGIEYEGDKLSEDDGIRATLNLLKKLRTQI
jgi:sugar phosphate isomerase/epimerase